MLYGGPAFFGTVMRMVTPLLDKRTSQKIVSACGDNSIGSANDTALNKVRKLFGKKPKQIRLLEK